MSKFKIGDRVRVFDRMESDTGTVAAQHLGWDMLDINYDNKYMDMATYVHQKQCRKLKPKRLAREWWINERSIKNSAAPIEFDGWSDLFESNDGYFISSIKPENTDGWICVREVLGKK